MNATAAARQRSRVIAEMSFDDIDPFSSVAVRTPEREAAGRQAQDNYRLYEASGDEARAQGEEQE